MTADQSPHSPPPDQAVEIPAASAPPGPGGTWGPSRRERLAASAPAPRWRPDLLLWAISGMVMVYVWQLHQLVPALSVIKPAAVTTLPALGLWLVDADRRRRLTRLRNPVLTLVLALVGLMVLSVPGSYWIGNSVRFLSKDFIWTLVLMLLIASSIRTGRDVAWYALVNLVGATVFVIDRLIHFEGTEGARLGTAAYDANDTGLLIVCAIPFAVYFLRRAVTPWVRFAALGSLGLLLVSLMKTGSRGGFLGFIVMTLYLLFHFRGIRQRTRVVAVVTGLVVMVAVGSDAYWQRISTMLRPKEDYNFQENVISGRMAVWKRGVGYMFSRPLTGVGVACFAVAEGASPVAMQQVQSGRGFKWSVSHNSFVEIGAELGVFGLIVFVAIFVTGMKAMARLRTARPMSGAPPPEADAALGETLVASMLAFMVAGFFLSQAYYANLYAMFGMVIGLAKLHPEVFAPQRAGRLHRRSAAA